MGEPINPEAWQWYYETVGQSRCPIVDTWWQTETGACLITPLPGAHAIKPGSAPAVLRRGTGAAGRARQGIEGAAERQLVIHGQLAGSDRGACYGDHDRLIDTYFKTYPGITSPATARAATRTATTGSPGGSTTCSTSPDTAWAPPRWKARWSPPKGGRGGGGRHARTT
ncbi:hypothetical protein ACG3RN_04375 [Pseudomonas aeruginosa]